MKTKLGSKVVLLAGIITLALSPHVTWAQAYWTNLVTASAQNWNNNANWTNVAVFPSGNGQAVVITNAIGGNQTINLNQGITVGSIVMGRASARYYTIAPNGGSLTFQNNGSPATLTEAAFATGGDTISSGVTLADPLLISQYAGASKQLTLSGNIGESGGSKSLTVTGLTFQVNNGVGSVVLGGVNNYSGGTTLNGAVLSVGGYSSLPVGNLNFSGGALQVTGTQITNLNNYTVNWNSFSGGLDVNASGNTMVVTNNIVASSFAKYGVGALELRGSTNVIADFWPRSGTLVLNGGTHVATNVYIARYQGDNSALLVISNGATLTIPAIFQAGVIAGTTGIVNQVGGTVNVSAAAISFGVASSVDCGGIYKLSGGALNYNSGQHLDLGGGNNAFGVFRQTAGTFFSSSKIQVPRGNPGYGFYGMDGGMATTVASLEVGSGLGSPGGSGGLSLIGLYYQSSGTNCTGYSSTTPLYIGVYGVGVFYLIGGQLYVSNNTYMSLGHQTNGVGEVTIAGGEMVCSNANPYILFNYTVGANTTNTFTLGSGGVVRAKMMYKNTAGGLSVVNFNGGTFQSSASGIMMGPGTAVSGSGFTNALDAAYVQSGGVVIDTQGYTVTNAQNLLAPIGKGVTAIALASPINGYYGAPYVQLSGGDGSGATAVALMDLSGSSYGNVTGGSVTGIVVGGYGSGYTIAPTVTLLKGGVASTNIGTATISTLTSGGLVKLGSGTLVLTGTNTYTGDTVIPDAGTLVVGNPLALQGSTLNYTNGTVKFDAGTTAYTLGGLAGTQDIGLTNTAGTALTLKVGGNGHSTTYSGALSKSGASLVKVGTGTLTLSGNNTYTGGTTVSNGTLLVNGSITGAVTMAGGSLGGGGSVSGSVTFASASTITTTITNSTGGATCLAVAGPLDITGASLAIQDSSHYLANPSSVTPYRIVTCQPNGLSGSFANVTGLTNGWYVAYDKAAGQITLRFHNGTLIEIQ